LSKFLLRRLVNSLILVAIATSLAYILAGTSLNPRARFEGRTPPPPPAAVERRLDELNANDRTPILERYGTWVGGIAHGDFGRTIDGDPVREEMGRRIAVSLRLLLLGIIIGGAVGVLAGAWGAIRQYHASDHAITLLSFVVLSTPVFVLAVVLEIVAIGINDAVGAKLFLYTGESSPGLEGGFVTHLGDRLQHLVLPTMTLALLQIAIFSRYQRSAMLDVLGSDYVRTAQAKGLRRRRALFKHALRTALIPSVTYFSYSFGLLLVSATFTEKIFGWHGMGEWLVQSIGTADINAVAAVTCFTGVLVLISGLLSDIAYALLDPRVRVS
jgi:peptide/nickel transport system permease protein